jgi:hypothetical protein
LASLSSVQVSVSLTVFPDFAPFSRRAAKELPAKAIEYPLLVTTIRFGDGSPVLDQRKNAQRARELRLQG